jgi:hypothetical protein
MIITVNSLKAFRALLRDIEEHTEYEWAGSEGKPTNMRDDAYFKYADCFSIRIVEWDGTGVLQYGDVEDMKDYYQGTDYKIVSYEQLCQVVRRF